MDVFGTKVVILGSLTAAQELLEKRGAIYSDRPWSTMANLIGYDNLLLMQPYNEKTKHTRRMVLKAIGSQALTRDFMPLMSQTVQDFVSNLLASPEHFTSYLRQ